MEKDAVAQQLLIVGGSAGSLEWLLRIVTALPAQTKLAVLVVVHRRNGNDSILTDLLKARTGKKVKEVEDKEPIRPETIYVAPSDYHLLVEDTQSFALDSSEKIHFSRPSIDVSFMSAAQVFGRRCAAILLSGANADGAEGLLTIQEAGGFVAIQDPQLSEVGFMPQQALNLLKPDAIISQENLREVVEAIVSREC
jgi:two-component system chemotaxis response regulator CheB